MTKKSDEIKQLLDPHEIEELRQEATLSVVEDRVDPQVIIEAMLKKMAEKKNPLIFFQDKDAQMAIGQLGASDQGEVWIKVKEFCPGINLVQAKRAVKEAAAKAKRDRAGTMPARGLIQSNGAYYIERQTANGPIIAQISNFVLEPLTRLIMPDNKELLRVNVYLIGSDKPFERILSTGDLLGRKEILKALGSVSAQWTGNDTTVQELVGHLANVEVPVKRGVPYIGLYQDRFITPGMVVTAEGPELDSEYVYVPQRSVYEGYIKFSKNPDWPSLARLVIECMPYLQPPPVIWPVVGWFFSCMAAPTIRKRFNEFPILHAWGTGGGGKTSLYEILLKLLGVQAEPFVATTKEFVLLKTISGTNALPIFLDEYRPATMDPKRLKSLHEILLLVYKASIASRGRPDQTLNEYPLWAPVCMAGESPLPDNETGLLERVVQVRFDRNYVDTHPEAQEKFNELVPLPLSEFAAGYAVWLLNRDDILSDYDTALIQVDKVLSGLKVAVRVKHNLATVLTGILMFRELAKEVGAQLPKINLLSVFRGLAGEDNARRQEPKNAIDQFMIHLESMAHNGELRPNVDFILQEENPPRLIIYFNAAIAAQKKYCKARGLDTEMVNDKALRVMLDEKLSDYIMIPYGHRARIGNQNVRTTVINAQRLEEVLGIGIDIWRPRSGTTWNTNGEGSFIKNIDKSTVLEDEPF